MKTISLKDAAALIPDGASVLIGGGHRNVTRKRGELVAALREIASDPYRGTPLGVEAAWWPNGFLAGMPALASPPWPTSAESTK